MQVIKNGNNLVNIIKEIFQSGFTIVNNDFLFVDSVIVFTIII